MRVRAKLSVLWIIGTVLAAAACHSSTSPSGAQALELRRHEAQWRAQGIHDYAFDYDVLAMVAPRPVRIVVRGDAVAEVVVRDTGERLQDLDRWPTVDSLFAEAQRVIERDQYRAAIIYDGARGFPAHIDATSGVPDTGFTLDVHNFVPAN